MEDGKLTMEGLDTYVDNLLDVVLTLTRENKRYEAVLAGKRKNLD